jgi:hypothetical protein
VNALWSGLSIGIGGLFLYLLGTLNGTLMARSEQREALKRGLLLPLVQVDTADWWSSDGHEEVWTHE